MKVATWNINSIRVRLDPVLDRLEKHRPDVVLFQETRDRKYKGLLVASR